MMLECSPLYSGPKLTPVTQISNWQLLLRHKTLIGMLLQNDRWKLLSLTKYSSKGKRSFGRTFQIDLHLQVQQTSRSKGDN